MIVSMNVSHFVQICQVLTISHQLICRGVANFGTRCSSFCSISENAAVKELLKLVNIWRSYCENKKGAIFFWFTV